MSEFLYSCVNLIFDIKEYGLYFLKFFVYMLCVHVMSVWVRACWEFWEGVVIKMIYVVMG